MPQRSPYQNETAGLSGELMTISYPIADSTDLDPLLERIGKARYVLLGEASHGTHDYYLWRARITRRLIEEKGFSFVAVEGDWPDCARVNRYIRGKIPEQTAEDVLGAFARWPTWMWANREIVALAEWLRLKNPDRATDDRLGFYGLDVYSLWESLAAIRTFLRNRDGAQAAAEAAYRCFEPYDEDPQQYAVATRFVPADCEEEVIALLSSLVAEAGTSDDDFDALMNAEALKSAESYYRTMISGGADSWNLRDRHMAETLNRVMRHHGPDAKAVVWEHNTHVGDARYTDMATVGMFNVGQLVRETRSQDDVVLVGFGSHQGTVIAGPSWGAPMQTMTVPPARTGSWEQILHDLNGEDRLLLFQGVTGDGALAVPRGHRAIGVVYRPEAETGNYVPTVLPLRYDAFIYLDRTEALHPLHVEETAKPPELYPWGV
jgi:erythromycin esterase-like protein